MKNKKIILSGILSLVISLQLRAQCAMCKAVVESNIDSGGSEGVGLNNGILYLMAIPYLAALSFGVFYYLQNKKTKAPSN
jgi:hypothetical protein